jgi:xanthine dehydrogenase YagR molybdenum-binding subunit
MTYAAPEPQTNMGQPIPRVDARLKVTGEAKYASDVDVPNPAFAYLVTSAIAKGSIRSIDDSEARKVNGLIDILTHENMTDAIRQVPFMAAGGPAATSIVPLSSPQIWHDGQIVAMVLADRFEAARDAARRLKITYVEEQPSATFGSPGVTEKPYTEARAKQKHENPAVGDFQAAFKTAPVQVEGTYATPTQHHNPIELFTTTCVWNGPNLTIHEPSQTVTGLAHGAAAELKLDPSQVRVLSPYIGGAFGSKGAITPRTAITAIAAKRLNRPVKLVATRAQGFTIASYRAETRHEVKLGATKDGKLVALSHEGWEVSSRPDDYTVAGTDASTRMYACPNIASAVNIVSADRNTPGFMRAPAETPYIYALEVAMDELAEKLNMDPIELRRVNDTIIEPIKGLPFTSRSLMPCFDRASKAFDWGKRNPKPGQTRDGDWLVGYGCAMACYPTQMAPAAARVRLEANGTARVGTAAHEIGNGAYTVVAQTAALKLGIDVSKVKVEMGDSALPPAPVAGGSITTASVCNAVAMACDKVIDRLTSGKNTDGDYILKEGRLVAANGEMEDLSKAFERVGAGAIEQYAEFVPHGSKPGAMAQVYKGVSPIIGGTRDKDRVSFAFGAQFIEVRVHVRTKEVRVPHILGAFAAGHIVNPRTTHSQLMGGMIWGLSSGLHEATEIDAKRAKYVNTNLADYLLPVNADIGKVDVILVPEVDDKVNPLGIKGVGELGIVGTAAALSNAVYNATGTRIRELPIRIEKLLA